MILELTDHSKIEIEQENNKYNLIIRTEAFSKLYRFNKEDISFAEQIEEGYLVKVIVGTSIEYFGLHKSTALAIQDFLTKNDLEDCEYSSSKYYTLKELCNTLGLKRDNVWHRLKYNNIPMHKRSKNTYVEKELANKVFNIKE